MRQELKYHLLPLLAVFFLTSLVWLFNRIHFIDFIPLFFGLGLGTYFLDLDHLLYWLYLNPNHEESQQARSYLASRDYKSVIRLLEATHKNHVSLIFHHFSFQIVLALISIFVFTSSNSIFGKSFLLALNLHLLVDELADYKNNRPHLQNWLFARESRQLSLDSLKYYLGIFLVTTLLFLFLLIRSRV